MPTTKSWLMHPMTCCLTFNSLMVGHKKNNNNNKAHWINSFCQNWEMRKCEKFTNARKIAIIIAIFVKNVRNFAIREILFIVINRIVKNARNAINSINLLHLLHVKCKKFSHFSHFLHNKCNKFLAFLAFIAFIVIFCKKYSPYAKNARNFAIREMAFITINCSAIKVWEMQEIPEVP